MGILSKSYKVILWIFSVEDLYTKKSIKIGQMFYL